MRLKTANAVFSPAPGLGPCGCTGTLAGGAGRSSPSTINRQIGVSSEGKYRQVPKSDVRVLYLIALVRYNTGTTQVPRTTVPVL